MHLNWFPQHRTSQNLVCAKSIGWALPALPLPCEESVDLQTLVTRG